MESQMAFFVEPDCDDAVTARHASFSDAFRCKIFLREVRRFGELFDRSSHDKKSVICRYPVGQNSFIGTRCILIDRYHGDEDFIVMIYLKPKLELARKLSESFVELVDDEICYEILIDGGGIANVYATCRNSTRRQLIAVIDGDTVPVPKQSHMAEVSVA